MTDKISTLDSYKTFKLKNQVSKKTYNTIIKTLNQKAFEKMLKTGQPYIEPNFGSKQIMKIKSKAKNHHLSKQLDKSINYTNFHTDGYIAKCIWHKSRLLMKFHNIWQFNFNRMLKRPNHKNKRALNMKDYIMQNGLDHLLEITQ